MFFFCNVSLLNYKRSRACVAGVVKVYRQEELLAWLVYLNNDKAIVVRLHVRKINVFILTPETGAQLVYEEKPALS